MFEVGFSELLMVGLVALLVIGPERLPKAARVAGLWVGKARRMMAGVQAEIHAELQAEEMRQIFREQTGLAELQELKDEFSQAEQASSRTLEEWRQLRNEDALIGSRQQSEATQALAPNDRPKDHEPQ